MKPIRALTFDLDNTLWETDTSILRAEDAMVRHLRDLTPARWMADFNLDKFHAIRLADGSTLIGWKINVPSEGAVLGNHRAASSIPKAQKGMPNPLPLGIIRVDGRGEENEQ